MVASQKKVSYVKHFTYLRKATDTIIGFQKMINLRINRITFMFNTFRWTSFKTTTTMKNQKK